MQTERDPRAGLRKIEALFAGAGTPGERDAAEAALERIRGRLRSTEQMAEPIEMQFSLGDPWTRQLFVALARRYGLRPYRHYRQRRTTVVLHAPEPFIRDVLWPRVRAAECGAHRLSRGGHRTDHPRGGARRDR